MERNPFWSESTNVNISLILLSEDPEQRTDNPPANSPKSTWRERADAFAQGTHARAFGGRGCERRRLLVVVAVKESVKSLKEEALFGGHDAKLVDCSEELPLVKAAAVRVRAEDVVQPLDCHLPRRPHE